MTNLRIGPRILIAFGLMVAVTVTMGAYALWMQRDAQQRSQQVDARDMRMLESLRQISQSEDDMRSARQTAITNHMFRSQRLNAGDPLLNEREWVQMRDRNLHNLSDLESLAAQYQNTAASPVRRTQWEKIQAAARGCREGLQTLSPEIEAQFALLNRGDIAQLVERLPTVEKLRQSYDDALSRAQSLTAEQVALGRSETEAIFADTQTSVLWAILLATALGAFFAFSIHRSIANPLTSFMNFAERVGHGDLTVEAPVSRRDELGDLARSLNQMAAGLKNVASESRRMAEDLGAATAEILASTQQQAAGTAEQAAAVQQANATMTEITQSGAQISERARQVAASAEATSGSSAAGLQSVQNTAANMESIREQAEAVAENVIALSEKTQAIGEIIATVNDLAEQSHLLALNAAIEAAAAGEHGRSFSVVAGEMKNLAEQSKQATVQVRSILGDIQKAINSSVMLTEEAVKRIESGRQQAGVSDRTIRALTDNIQQSVQAFQQIVAGSSQQQIGFEQVMQAFRNIGVAAQQTAASTKQSEKAAANLNLLAQQLRAVVEKYHI